MDTQHMESNLLSHHETTRDIQPHVQKLKKTKYQPRQTTTFREITYNCGTKSVRLLTGHFKKTWGAEEEDHKSLQNSGEGLDQQWMKR